MNMSDSYSHEYISQALKKFKIKGKCIAVKQHKHFFFCDLILEPGAYKKLNSSLDELSIYLKSFSKPILKVKSSEGIIQLQLTTGEPIKLILNKNDLQNESQNTFLLGETVEGKNFHFNLDNDPHLLIAGTTGSGKTNLLHNIIKNALYKNNIEIHLIDPKKIEFSSYLHKDKIYSVSSSYKDACNILQFVHKTMEDRYQILSKNKYISLSTIVVIIDELADIMFQDEKQHFEMLLAKIAAKARACKIHLVAATQRPSVNVITGLIKSNFPARLACKVASRVDSQIILDELGAENLLGKGDALFKGFNSDLVRIQIALTN